MRSLLAACLIVPIMSGTISKTSVRGAYQSAGCCPLLPNHEPCAIVSVGGNEFTCEELHEMYCGEVSDYITFDDCELCYGVHTHGACATPSPLFVHIGVWGPMDALGDGHGANAFLDLAVNGHYYPFMRNATDYLGGLDKHFIEYDDVNNKFYIGMLSVYKNQEAFDAQYHLVLQGGMDGFAGTPYNQSRHIFSNDTYNELGQWGPICNPTHFRQAAYMIAGNAELHDLSNMTDSFMAIRHTSASSESALEKLDIPFNTTSTTNLITIGELFASFGEQPSPRIDAHGRIVPYYQNQWTLTALEFSMNETDLNTTSLGTEEVRVMQAVDYDQWAAFVTANNVITLPDAIAPIMAAYPFEFTVGNSATPFNSQLIIDTFNFAAAEERLTVRADLTTVVASYSSWNPRSPYELYGQITFTFIAGSKTYFVNEITDASVVVLQESLAFLSNYNTSIEFTGAFSVYAIDSATPDVINQWCITTNTTTSNLQVLRDTYVGDTNNGMNADNVDRLIREVDGLGLVFILPLTPGYMGARENQSL